MECVVQSACRGRPREFDVDEALAAALRVFWTKGYDGASLSDLTDAMGITRPSLYAAFGNKESLFRKALDLYEREKLAYVGEALAAPTSRQVAERLLRGAMNHAAACASSALSLAAPQPIRSAQILWNGVSLRSGRCAIACAVRRAKATCRQTKADSTRPT